MFKTQGFAIGDVFGLARARLFNRTGALLAKGSPAILDIAQSQAEVTNFNLGDEASIFGNVILPTQALVNQGVPVPLAMEDIADDEPGWFAFWAPRVPILCLADSVSTTDADAGDGIGLLVSESAAACQAYVTGGRNLGLWYQDAPATGDPALKYGFWTGGVPCLGCNL